MFVTKNERKELNDFADIIQQDMDLHHNEIYDTVIELKGVIVINGSDVQRFKDELQKLMDKYSI